jgi:hypothetical protein
MSKIKLKSNIPPWKRPRFKMAGYKTPELKDDDVIHAAWVDDGDYQGY